MEVQLNLQADMFGAAAPMTKEVEMLLTVLSVGITATTYFVPRPLNINKNPDG
jgi:hypothetical protein